LEGRFNPKTGADHAVDCVHCAAGTYSDAAGRAACKLCAKGRFGASGVTGATDHLTHCLTCPAGQFQEADGMTTCVHCESGKYTHDAHDMIQCLDCAVVDDARKYDTKGLAGQAQCWPVPVDCKEGPYSLYDTCTRSCATGQQTRTRTPLRQPSAPAACGVDPSLCNQAWGGGRECDSSTYTWSETRKCNEHPCPVDCVVSQWGHWDGCTKTCGSGGTYRVRVVTTPLKDGGKECPALRDPVVGLKPCNQHKCGLDNMGTCHLDHVRCHVHQMKMHSQKSFLDTLPACGHSAIEDQNVCWNNYNCVSTPSRNCHEADDDEERAQAARVNAEYTACMAGQTLVAKGEPNEQDRALRDAARKAQGLSALQCANKFATLVVTHDKKYADTGGNFHCRGKKNSAGVIDTCKCTCNTHAPCCAMRNKLLGGNRLIVGNRYTGVDAMQSCCDLCTNHPTCTAWEYDTDQVCILKHGSVEYVENQKPAEITTWAGTPSGTSCTPYTISAGVL
jgi:hypothetical protein